MAAAGDCAAAADDGGDAATAPADAVVAAGADESAASAAREREDTEKLALIGQELVPVGVQEVEKKETSEVGRGETKLAVFHAPVAPRPEKLLSEKLQIQNTPAVKANDGSSQKKETEGRVVTPVPNGPPVSYGPPVVSPARPLFSPEQVHQFNEQQQGSSMLPFGRDPVPVSEGSRIPGFLQGIFPGLDHLQSFHEQRQREAEWRFSMETMIEQLGLQLRASQNENLRLRYELSEVKKDVSRYGTPDEKSSRRHSHVSSTGVYFPKGGWGSNPAR